MRGEAASAGEYIHQGFAGQNAVSAGEHYLALNGDGFFILPQGYLFNL